MAYPREVLAKLVTVRFECGHPTFGHFGGVLDRLMLELADRDEPFPEICPRCERVVRELVESAESEVR